MTPEEADDLEAGARVRVVVPPGDWYDGAPAAFEGVVVYVNGDLVDVEDPAGVVDCYPYEWLEALP